MMLFLSIGIAIYVAGFYFSPFPYWKTYLVLWRTLLFDKNKTIDFAARRKQAKFLAKYVLLCPLWTFMWHLDDILFPGYKKVTVRPVFIMGQPRSGTTFLHRTLAADKDNFVAIKHIEWRFPFICLQKVLACSSWSQKLLQRNYWSDSSAGRHAAKMHPNTLSDWEEDGIFFEECFLHHFFIFLRFPYPQLLSYLDDFSNLSETVQNNMLATHRKVIQKIIFFRGGDDKKYYLSKEVTSHNKFEKLLKIYPEAKFIISFRYSADFMNSLLSLVRFSTKSKIGVDPIDVPMWESFFVERMKKDSYDLQALCTSKIEKSKQIRIMFYRFTEDIVSSVDYIYKNLDFDLSDTYRDHLHWIDQNQNVRERGYDYEKKSYHGFDEFDEFVKIVDADISLILQQNMKLSLGSGVQPGKEI